VHVRILLINPAMNLGKLGRFAKLLEPMPCIGLAYIAAALEQHGDMVRVIDMFAENLSADEVVSRAQAFAPELVGFTVLTPSAPVCEVLSRKIRYSIPGVKIVWGGVHADVFAKDIVRSSMADFAVHHDGEATVCELVDASVRESDFSKIDGSAGATDGTPVTNSRASTRTRHARTRRGTSSRTRSTGSSRPPTPAKPVLNDGIAAARTAAVRSPIHTGGKVIGDAIRSRSSTSTSTWSIASR
jgi:radical SAM superfamily enzyme YgiQ (UPF0313 family)